jgi:hypothetical protein
MLSADLLDSTDRVTFPSSHVAFLDLLNIPA